MMKSAFDEFMDCISGLAIIISIIVLIIYHFYTNDNWLDFVIIIIILFFAYRKNESKNKKIDSDERTINNLEYKNRVCYNEINNLKSTLKKCIQEKDQFYCNEISNLKKCIQEKDQFYYNLKDSRDQLFHISSLYADFITFEYDITAKYLETKKHPAFSQAKDVRELKDGSKKIIEQYKLMQYKYELLLQLFPELSNYVDDADAIKELNNYNSIDDLKESQDLVKNWISKEEYDRLDIDTRNQLALDKYIKSYNKSNWQVGRDYELYCGYVYRKDGWNVEQFGIEKKLNDMGRDLIARKDDCIHVVQCKLWAKDKFIHEKHIAQLYGSAIEYSMYLDLYAKVTPVFITSTELSDTAKRFAQKLGVIVCKWEMKEFPRIKCNINSEKIYHLPFDQQYDKTKIEKGKGEFYAFTVKEAVEAGFRRAFKHYK